MKQRNKVKDQEKEIASRVGGKRQPMSGALKEMKSDVVSDRLRIDCKLTDKKSYSIKLSDLKKIIEESFGQNREPVIQIRFNQAGKFGPNRVVNQDWVVISLRFFEELLGNG
jgi:hypothetical protein